MLLLSFAQLYSEGQDILVQDKYHSKLQLIDSLKSFIANDLRLFLPPNFYTEWSKPGADSMYCYLYISKPEEVAYDTAMAKTPIYFNKEQYAIETGMAALHQHGDQILLYKTAGMSNAELSNKLLSYPPDAIAFIIFHEATHRNIHHRVPYNYEEALCDVVANIACRMFAAKTHLIDVSAVKKQQQVVERSYAYLNRQRKVLGKTKPKAKPALFAACTRKIFSLTRDANQFQKDRMNYQVNNAYFLREADYAINYFTIKNLFQSKFDFESVILQIRNLNNN